MHRDALLVKVPSRGHPLERPTSGASPGRFKWGGSTRLGVVSVPVVTPWMIVAIALGTLVVANVLATGPALIAARTRPASLLRSE
jgi:hypothetical protein